MIGLNARILWKENKVWRHRPSGGIDPNPSKGVILVLHAGFLGSVVARREARLVRAGRADP